jgi:hypothetical protein
VAGFTGADGSYRERADARNGHRQSANGRAFAGDGLTLAEGKSVPAAMQT